MRVLVLTTSYPRHEGDFAGRFLADTVERLEARGIEVDLLAPGRGYRDFGLAYGEGMSRNVRAPTLGGAAAPRLDDPGGPAGGRRADVVHAHWLPTGFPAALSGKPFVLTLHGTDVELARHAPAVARRIVRRAAVVIGVSQRARRGGLGPRRARRPLRPQRRRGSGGGRAEAEPAEVLFAGRLSPEKGIEDLLAVADGLDLVVAGDGPLRSQVPQALGMVLARASCTSALDRAAVVVFPSRRDGFPVSCAEAMAHGRAVVATAVGGLPDMVVDGETGVLVPAGDPAALRSAIDRLLADPELRARLGHRRAQPNRGALWLGRA